MLTIIHLGQCSKHLVHYQVFFFVFRIIVNFSLVSAMWPINYNEIIGHLDVGSHEHVSSRS